MRALEDIKSMLELQVEGVRLELVPNASASGQPSLLVDKAHVVEVARFLRDHSELRFDYASNVTGVDWPERILKDKIKVKKVIDGVEKEVEETVERKTVPHLEAVYHLYSMALKQGPLVLRMRTGNRTDQCQLPSLTPVWRSCEFQEREIFDLFGLIFTGHPDLRRLLMWDEFVDHPMRKDYVAPDDYEYEPTPHDQVLEKAKVHYPKEAA